MVDHPIQPLVQIDGVLRFKRNAIVRFLLDTSKNNLNDLSMMPFTKEDWLQFYQLIGYSVDGFAELNDDSGANMRIIDQAEAEYYKEL